MKNRINTKEFSGFQKNNHTKEFSGFLEKNYAQKSKNSFVWSSFVTLKKREFPLFGLHFTYFGCPLQRRKIPLCGFSFTRFFFSLYMQSPNIRKTVNSPNRGRYPLAGVFASPKIEARKRPLMGTCP